MDDDLFSRDYEPRQRKGDNLFTWTVLILLLIGFAFACWLGSFYIFGHPENARSYKILKKLHKVEPPRRFELTAAPPGEFLAPQKLYERYFTFTPLQLKNENDELMRNYINNYQLTKKLIPYVTGRFNILDSFELKNSDLFSPGVAALAVAADTQNVLLEHVYTTPSKNVPLLRKMLMPGLDIKLEKNLDLAAVIHVERLQDGRLQFTVVPLLYGSYALRQGSGGFNLEPPNDLNLEAGAPIIRASLLQEAIKTYATAGGKTGASAKAAQTSGIPATTPATAELVRVEASPTPEEKPMPVAAASTPEPGPAPSATPVAMNSPAPKASPAATPPVIKPSPVPVVATPPRPATPSPAPLVATAAPVAVSPQGVPLQPFLAAAPTPGAAAPSGGSWRTYSPGQMPRGRLVEPADANQMAEHGVSGERIYLRGNFVVTASKGSRVVLRSHSSLAIGSLIKGGSGSIRIIVDYPAGANPPDEGASFSRDETRPFQITDVRRGSDGQINIYAREITVP
jgi:hypothetical protein